MTKMTVIIPSSAAEVVADPAAFLKAVREGKAAAIPDFDYEAAAALADVLAEEEMLGEMATFREATTGIHNTIFLSTKEGVRHGPRIKVTINPPTHLKCASRVGSCELCRRAHPVFPSRLAQRLVRPEG
jgi:hypothetical protein